MDLPTFIKNTKSDNLLDLYTEYIADLDEKPTLDQFHYQLTMYFKERHVTWLRLRLEEMKQIYDGNPNIVLLDQIHKLEDKIRLETDAILKYTSIGMNRDAPRKMEITDKRVNIQQINSLLKDSKKRLTAIDAEFKVNDD